jgi:dTDP-4-amino-4,6-dideoxygalactose transaminase
VIPILDLKTQYKSNQPEIDAAIKKVPLSSQFVLEPGIWALEEQMVVYREGAHGIGVASRTDALA